ncbi:MAG: response regulator [Myxococcota bacterium]
MALTRERFEQLIARSVDSVVGTDRPGSVIYYNDGAKRILGYEPDEILGTPVVRLYPDLDEARRVMAAMRDPGYGGLGIVESFQTSFVSKQGEQIPVAISGTVLLDEQGEEDGSIGFAKDLREILRKDQLATLGEVAVGLSHELNNPLAVIVNQLDLLERDLVRLAGEADISVEGERLDALRREAGRISEILERLAGMAQQQVYETIEYIGPAKMIDLRRGELREHVPDPRLAGLHILVVDDDLGIRGSLAEILEADHCVVQTAGDGVEALRCLDGVQFDLVLSDVVMPNMDGFELYTAIQKRHPQLPVIMMTAFHYDRDHVIKRSRIAGLPGVVFKKPLDPARLRRVIAETVEQARKGQSA